MHLSLAPQYVKDESTVLNGKEKIKDLIQDRTWIIILTTIIECAEKLEFTWTEDFSWR